MEAIRINQRWKNILALLSERTWVSIEDILIIIPNLKYARRVMRELMNLGLVKHTQCSLPFQSRGPGMNFYALKKASERFFDSQIKEPKLPTSTHLYHFYITNFFLTGFNALSKSHNGFLSDKIAEKELRSMCHEFSYSEFSSQRIAIPDFALSIGSREYRRLFLGEVDTKTETISNDSADSLTIANKFDSITRSAKKGLLEKLSATFSFKFSEFSYLLITSGNNARINNIVDEINKVSPSFPVYVSCFTDFLSKDISYEKLIERTWHSKNNDFVSILEEI
jgi:hypothetical protein